MLPGVALTDRDANGSAVVQVGAGVFNLSVTGAIATVGSPVHQQRHHADCFRGK
jgi:hypothetical protein